LTLLVPAVFARVPDLLIHRYNGLCAGWPHVFVLESRTTRVLALELKVLRALCANPSAEGSRKMVIRELSIRTWENAEHRIVFEAITRLGGRDPQRLREDLPAQATRMGFPDVDWGAYLVPEGAPPTDLEALVRDLTAASSADPGPNLK
jgi:hypothetical protein